MGLCVELPDVYSLPLMQILHVIVILHFTVISG